MTKSWRALGALLLALLLLAAACGGDDGDDEETGSGSETTETTETSEASDGDDSGDSGDDNGEGASADIETYCDRVFEIETLGEPDVDFEADPAEVAEQLKAFAAENMVPLAEAIDEVAPDEIREEIDVQVAAVQDLAETGDPEAFENDPEVQEAQEVTHAFDVENCGWTPIEVTAIDYGFEGLDDTEAGPASFEFTNDSDKEFHELALARKNDGVTETAEELLALPEEEAMEKVTIVGGTFAEPGDSGYLVADLEAGDYVAVCFIPVGATPENEEGSGPPHFTQGMVTEFTVG
jgi:hypothetical protein